MQYSHLLETDVCFVILLYIVFFNWLAIGLNIKGFLK